eukprot:3417800-Alexandrium_andersonii.AAC.1
MAEKESPHALLPRAIAPAVAIQSATEAPRRETLPVLGWQMDVHLLAAPGRRDTDGHGVHGSHQRIAFGKQRRNSMTRTGARL